MTLLKTKRLIITNLIIFSLVLSESSLFETSSYAVETQNATDRVIQTHGSFSSNTSQRTPTGSFLLYQEAVFLPQQENAVSEGRLIYQWQGWNSIRPYVGLALGQDLKSNSTEIFNDNHVSPLLGLRYAPRGLPFGIYAEFRDKFRVLNQPLTRNSSELDFRSGAYLYQWFTLSQPSSFLSLFQEAYGEGLYSSALDHNIILQGWLKQGFRTQVLKGLDFDGYFELAGTYDQIGLPYQRFGYGDIGIRANLRFSSLLTQIIFKKPIVWTEAPASIVFPWTTQLVISGEF